MQTSLCIDHKAVSSFCYCGPAKEYWFNNSYKWIKNNGVIIQVSFYLQNTPIFIYENASVFCFLVLKAYFRSSRLHSVDISVSCQICFVVPKAFKILFHFHKYLPFLILKCCGGFKMGHSCFVSLSFPFRLKSLFPDNNSVSPTSQSH